MKKRRSSLGGEQSELRDRAESRAVPEPAAADVETRRLLHELQVHRIELELQNAELREARAELEASLERYTDLYDFAPVGYFTLDRHGVIVQTNLAGARLLGRDRSQVVGRRFDVFVTEDARPPFSGFLARVFAGRSKAIGEAELSAADGRCVIVRLAADTDAAGQACRLAAVDITEQVRAAAELERHRRQLEDRVAARTAELEAARIAAEAANRAKTRFLANMSHEIRTPMNAIVGFTYLLQKRITDPSAASQLRKIADSAQHLLSIINDVLDLAGIEADKLPLDRTEFELESVFEAIATQFCDKAAGKGLELVFEIDPAVPVSMQGSLLHLIQVLLNLVGNAVKFTEQGYVLVRAAEDPRSGRELWLRFEVRDTGIGIAAEKQAGVFLPFEQADDSTTRRYGGTGLGLAISRRLVLRMGGEIGVDSRPDEGSRFWFAVPLGRTIQGCPAAATAWVGRRALVADDLPQARGAVAGMLHTLGLRVDSADSGADALARIEHAEREGDPFEVVLIDQQMPERTGLETARCLQALRLARPPHLLLTTFGESLAADEVKHAGFGAVLQKPATRAKLRASLSRLADKIGAGPRQPSAGDARAGFGSCERFRGGRLLLVEDDPINREVALEQLRDAEFDVDIAVNGAEAVAMAQRVAYDLILMDLQMPVMDGIDATRAIRRIPGRETTPILAMTASAFDEDRALCLEAGMNDHLGKPVMPDILLAKLGQWLREPAE